MENLNFQNDAPMLKYCQKSLNSCYFSSLESDFTSIKQTKAANDISLRIEEYLNGELGNRIDIANDILKNETKLKANQEFIISRRNMEIWVLMIFSKT